MDGSPTSPSAARPGGHRLRPEVVAHHQRERILTAVVEVVAERGYRATTVTEIVKREKSPASVSMRTSPPRRTASSQPTIEPSRRRCAEWGEGVANAEDSFAARVSAGIGALLGYMSEQPELARACLLEAPSLGSAARKRNEQVVEVFAGLLRDHPAEPGAPEPPAGAEESVLGGLYWLIYQALLSGEPQRIEDLRPDLVEFALAPYLGAEIARQASAV